MDVLSILPDVARPKNGIVRIPVALLQSLGYSVRAKKEDKLPGHVVVPELNIVDYKKNKQHFIAALKTLADTAHSNIVLRPAPRDSEGGK